MITDPTINTGAFGVTFLGRTGLRVSRLCLGTMTFGSQLNEDESHRLLDYALERGIFFFDTANAYSSGEAERILGSWLGSHRDRVVIGSKVRYQVGADVMSVGLSRRTIKREVERSLKRLNTDYLDILYLHQPDASVAIEETLRTTDDLIREGKILYVGVSNFAAWQITEAHWLAERYGLTPPTIVQPMYNLVTRTIEQELLPCCNRLNLGVFVYNPLAAGLLTGKHSFNQGIEKGGRFEVLAYYQDRYWHQQTFEAVESLKRLAERCGRSLISLAFQWLLDCRTINGIILGASSLEQLQENLDSFGAPLDAETVRVCDLVWNNLRGPIPVYHR